MRSKDIIDNKIKNIIKLTTKIHILLRYTYRVNFINRKQKNMMKM